MEQIQERKLNWEPNLHNCKKYIWKEYSGSYQTFFTDFGYLLIILLATEQAVKEM